MAGMLPTQEEALSTFGPVLVARGATYKKIGRAFVKKAAEGEVLETIFDGKVETTNTAGPDEYIVRADTAAKERYILPSAKFQRLYDQTPIEFDDHPDAAELKAEGFQAYKPCGRIVALEVDADVLAEYFPMGKFLAAWGSEMLVELGDFLAGPAPVDGAGGTVPAVVGEIYRIEKSAFAQTYSSE